MKRIVTPLCLLALAVVLLAPAAIAQTEGINLAWDDCRPAGNESKSFTCDSNIGAPFTMYGSYIPPAGINQFLGIEAVVDMISSQADIGDWWKVQPGGCRAGAAVAGFNFTIGPFTCVDIFAGQASGGVIVEDGATTSSIPGANRTRFKIVAAIASPTALTAGTEYYGFSLTVLRTNTNTCTAGCADDACLVLNSLLVAQPAGVGDVLLTSAPAGGDRDVVWQGTSASCATVPTKNRTWGQVKHLYR